MITNLIDQLIRDEGEVLYAYQDSAGYWTIGAGVLIDHRKGGGITHSESRFLLWNRITTARDGLLSALPWVRSLDAVRQDCLVNMAFNLGVAGLLAFPKTLAAVKAGDWTAAAAEMADSTWARQVGDRAKRLAQQMLLGVYQ